MILGEVSEKEYLSHCVIGGTMPRLNRIFEEMKVTYGDHKIPDKVLKFVEAKAVKAAKSTAPSAATGRVESRKRKRTGAPKTVAKKRKSSRAAKDPATEEMEESGHEGSAAAPTSAAASTAAGDEDMMGSSVRGLAVLLPPGLLTWPCSHSCLARTRQALGRPTLVMPQPPHQTARWSLLVVLIGLRRLLVWKSRMRSLMDVPLCAASESRVVSHAYAYQR